MDIKNRVSVALFADSDEISGGCAESGRPIALGLPLVGRFRQDLRRAEAFGCCSGRDGRCHGATPVVVKERVVVVALAAWRSQCQCNKGKHIFTPTWGNDPI